MSTQKHSCSFFHSQVEIRKFHNREHPFSIMKELLKENYWWTSVGLIAFLIWNFLAMPLISYTHIGTVVVKKNYIHNPNIYFCLIQNMKDQVRVWDTSKFQNLMVWVLSSSLFWPYLCLTFWDVAFKHFGVLGQGESTFNVVPQFYKTVLRLLVVSKLLIKTNI